MEKLFLLICCFTPVCLPQTDTMTIELTNGSIKQYNITTIASISFSNPTTDIKEQEMMKNILSSFLVHQNYPNPFNPSTTIEYEIPLNGPVEINIFDIQGRLVQVLEKSYQQQGKHAISWNGKNTSRLSAASGIYFCQITYDDIVLTKKLLLIK